MTEVAELNQELATLSRLIVLGSLTIYSVAFLILAWSLTKRASEGKTNKSALKLENIGLILMALGVVIHFVGVLTRGIAAHRVPWANICLLYTSPSPRD